MDDRASAGRATQRLHMRKLRKVTIGRREVLTAGIAPSFWNDLYFGALTATWPAFLGGLALTFVGLNVLFAVLYALVPDAIANSHGDLETLFYFSAETITTVGYGEFYPQTRYGHIVVSTEVFTGLFFSASMLGLIFARLSRPRARLVFARHLTIGPHDGLLTLSVRVANARLNILSSATARLWLLSAIVTAEGTSFRRFEELRLARAENPTFALSWTLMHPIDEASPLFGRTHDDLVAQDAVLILTIAGLDETTGQTVQGRESYAAADLRWDHRYADILSTLEDGTQVLDYDRFHLVEPLAQGLTGLAKGGNPGKEQAA